MVREDYAHELGELKEDLLKMGELAKNSADDAISSLVNRDVELASRVIEGGSEIDSLEFDIEKRCMELIALQQPMAIDLRTIGTCLKIITDLDRVSDLAADIAEIVKKIANEPLVKPLIDIPRMSKIAQSMLEDCLEAFSSYEIERLEDLSSRDDEVDSLFDQIRRELITFMIEDPRTIKNAGNLLFVALHLERIADHACNIGSRIVYMVTGKRVKME